MGYPDVSSFAFIVVFLITITTIRPGSEEGNQLLKIFGCCFPFTACSVWELWGSCGGGSHFELNKFVLCNTVYIL